MNLEEEDADEAEVVLSDQKIWNAGPVEEEGTCQKNAQNPNTSCAIKKGIQLNSAWENR